MNSSPLKPQTRTSLIDRLLLPAIVGLTTAICVLILWQRLVTQQSDEMQTVTRAQALVVKNKLESELNSRILPLELLRERWQVRGYQNDADFQSDAALVVNLYPVYQAIEWVDPTFHVRWAMPQQQTEAGIDGVADENRRITLLAAKDSGRVMITHEVDWGPDRRGLFVCVPAYTGENLAGFVLGAFLYQNLFNSILQGVSQNYGIALYDGGQEIYNRAKSAPSAQAQEEDIDFQQLTWRAKVWPNPEILAFTRSPLPQVTFVGGLLMAGLLAFVVYMAETAALQARQVKIGNEKLKREIAGREQTEEALRHAQKMEAVGRLAGGVAHDFNNLLMVIGGQASLLLSGFGPLNPARQGLREIVKASDRASKLTRQLLAFSRKQVLQPKVLDLNNLVTHLAEWLPPALGEDIRLHLDLEPTLGRVKADASQIEQVIMNLVFNARDAMPHGGELAILTANTHLDESWAHGDSEVKPGPHVMLTVRDTGLGMDSETQLHIFEPFFSTKDRGKGTGLGLATVYGTVRQSGGCITVSSQLGEGTTVQIYFPQVMEAIEVREERPAFPPALHGSEKILVVEDDDAVRRMTLEFLKISGYTVFEAKSGEEAVQFVAQHPEEIDLVLTDVIMPGLTGRELGERLLRLHPNLTILYMSAHTEDIIVNHDMLGRGMPFIEKPFSPDELAGKVRAILDANRKTLL